MVLWCVLSRVHAAGPDLSCWSVCVKLYPGDGSQSPSNVTTQCSEDVSDGTMLPPGHTDGVEDWLAASQSGSDLAHAECPSSDVQATWVPDALLAISDELFLHERLGQASSTPPRTPSTSAHCPACLGPCSNASTASLLQKGGVCLLDEDRLASVKTTFL